MNHFACDRSELTDVNYHYGLVEAGEQAVVRVLQESLQRQSSTNSLNKQLFQERENYLSETEVSPKENILLNDRLSI